MMKKRIESIYEMQRRITDNREETVIETEVQISEASSEVSGYSSTNFLKTVTHLHRFDRISIGLLFLLLVLLPIFFVPSASVPIDGAKGIILCVLCFLSFFFFLLARFIQKTIFFPRSIVWVGLFLLLFSTFISSFVSSAPMYSFFGRGIQINTFLFTVVVSLIAFIAASYLPRKRDIRVVVLALSVPFVLVFLFQFFRGIFGPSILSFGYFTTSFTSVFGNWYDLPAFFGFFTLLSLCARQFLWRERFLRVWSVAIVFASLLFLAFFPLSIVMALLLVFSFILFVLALRDHGLGRVTEARGVLQTAMQYLRKPFFLPLFVFLFSIVFLFFGATLSGDLSGLIGMNNTLQARPSIQATASMYVHTFHEGPATAALGTGPATFFQDWAKYRSSAINQTPWWNADFTEGSGYLPTKAVTLGIVGIISMIILLLGIVFESVIGFVHSRKEIGRRNIFFALFLPLYFLWILLLFYTPGIVMITFAFLFLGMAVAYVSASRPPLRFTFLQGSSRFKMTCSVIMIILLLLSLTGGAVASLRFRGTVLSNTGNALAGGSDVNGAESMLKSAISSSAIDSYYRNLAEVGVIKMRAIAQASTNGEQIDTKNLQTIFQATIQNAQRARDLDPANYHNYLFLGDLYRFFASLGVNGAYAQSKAYYLEGLRYAPNTPVVYLGLAQLEETQNNYKGANGYLTQALEKKSNYADAHLEKAKIALSQNDPQTAKTALSKAAFEIGNDPSLWYELGTLEYESGDHASAVTAFRNALVLVPNYSNAKYYLGLSYAKAGETKLAISAFQELYSANPKNDQLKKILENLKAGRDALAGVPS